MRSQGSILAFLRRHYPDQVSGFGQTSISAGKPAPLAESQNRSSAAFAGSFAPMLRFETLEIHRVFLRISNLALSQNLSPKALADTIRASFGIVGFIIAAMRAKVKGCSCFSPLEGGGAVCYDERKAEVRR